MDENKEDINNEQVNLVKSNENNEIVKDENKNSGINDSNTEANSIEMKVAESVMEPVTQKNVSLNEKSKATSNDSNNNSSILNINETIKNEISFNETTKDLGKFKLNSF